MCAIIGWNGQISNRMLRALFAAATPAGPHAVGLAYQEPHNVKVFKRACHPFYFLRNCNHRIERAAKSHIGFGHTRWGTHGDITDTKNAHPFQYIGDDREVWITFAHNGIIKNYQQILPSAVVDSECFGPLIYKRDTRLANGRAGLIWFEQDIRHGGHGESKMFVYRRDQGLSASRVQLITGEDAVIVHSRRAFLTEGRLADDIVYLEKIDFEPGIAFEVTSEGLKQVWRDSYGQAPAIESWEQRSYGPNYKGG